MKKEYLIPEMEITMLENYDVITSSTESMSFSSSESGKAETAAAGMNGNWASS